jgi:hypothetical protein
LPENDKVAGRLDRIVEAAYYSLAFRVTGVFEVLLERPSGDREAVASMSPLGKSSMARALDLNQAGHHHIFAARLEVSQTGTRLPTRVQSSRVSLTPAA